MHTLEQRVTELEEKVALLSGEMSGAGRVKPW
jgi:hypothetical protein